jgi:leader peptidase (prepilin peptidase)/N-methyltransferase
MPVLVFSLGLIIGSFLNVCIYRIPRNQSVVCPGSCCPQCGKRLAWFELIPVFSYIFIKGRCRHCRAGVSWRYPLIEILTGFLYYLAYRQFGLGFSFLNLAFLVSLLVVVSFIDIEFHIIPNRLVLLGLVVGLALGLMRPGNPVWFMVLGTAAGFGLMLLVAFLSGGRMGYGDVKLSAVLGLFLGWQAVLLAIFFAFAGGAVYGLILMLFFGKSRKTPVPFGPFLAAAAIVAYMWSEPIISWYLRVII